MPSLEELLLAAAAVEVLLLPHFCAIRIVVVASWLLQV